MFYSVELTCPACGSDMRHVSGSPPNGTWAAAVAICVGARCGRKYGVTARLEPKPC